MSSRDTVNALIDGASALYRPVDLFAYYRARGKLRGDPVFAGILKDGLLTGAQRILDLGCGQGLLAAWLLTARARHDEQPHAWPAELCAAPDPSSIRGIELSRREAQRAHDALDDRAQIEQGDITNADLGTADAVVILDVLHYLDYESQRALLDRVLAALAADGILLLRISDVDSGIRFLVGKFVDQTMLLTRYHRAPRVYCRPMRDWLSMLAAAGFHCEALPMSAGTPFANVLLIARPRKRVSATQFMKKSLLA